ncbi:uncharacterized protein TNCV_3943151 [Trichonephila clavipes]|nr:uncharacterized protein TNCV_3943151 [Trichonephila clavipes]
MTMEHFYYKHASQKHGLEARQQCVFCSGRYQWAYGQKNRPDHVHHVVSCLERFAQDAKDVWAFSEDEEEETEEVEEEKVCECRHFQPMPREMYGRRKGEEAFYDAVFEKPDMWEEGMDNGVGKDVWGIIQRYLKGDLFWCHIMVKRNIFHTFCKEMEAIRDQVVILPFWCLCDGLETEKGKIQHRHMILACEQERAFEQIWKGKVRYEFPSKGRAKKCVKIKNAFHLVRSIVYMSQPKSSCDGGRIPENLMDPEQLSHFHINRPLHPHSIAFLCTLFPGGIEKLLWEQLGNKNVSSWEKVTQALPDAWGHLKWNVPIHVTGWKFLKCKIPLRGERTEMPFYVYRNKKWYLNEGVLQQMRDEMYVLSRKQQNMMNEIKKVKQVWSMDQKVLLKSKLNEMNAKYDMIQRERDMLKEERDLLKTKEKEWETKEHELKTENTSLKIKLQSRAVVDKLLKRMIGSNRKLRGVNPWRCKRVKTLPRRAIVQSS